MKRLVSPTLTFLLAMCLLWPAFSQDPEEEPRHLPDGRLQSDAILEADYQKNIEDLDRIVKLTEEVKSELEKNDWYVLSIGSLKKMKEVEDLSKKVRSRMKRR